MPVNTFTDSSSGVSFGGGGRPGWAPVRSDGNPSSFVSSQLGAAKYKPFYGALDAFATVTVLVIAAPALPIIWIPTMGIMPLEYTPVETGSIRRLVVMMIVYPTRRGGAVGAHEGSSSQKDSTSQQKCGYEVLQKARHDLPPCVPVGFGKAGAAHRVKSPRRQRELLPLVENGHQDLTSIFLNHATFRSSWIERSHQNGGSAVTRKGTFSEKWGDLPEKTGPAGFGLPAELAPNPGGS